MRLILVRHAETDWNAEGRIQGRADIPLNTKGLRDAANWQLPSSLLGAKWFTSPLIRARETACKMGLDADPEPRLVEMDWGEWEGEKLASLRARPGGTMAANEAKGLDFLPPGGESPRMVQTRVRPWLNILPDLGGDIGAVTHKGVIRAIVALAAGWDMTGEPPARVSSGTAQVISVTVAGSMAIEAADVILGEEAYSDAID